MPDGDYVRLNESRLDRFRGCLLGLASGDAVNGIYFNPQPVPIREDMPMVAYPGYYPLSKVLEEAMFQQYYYQAGVPTVSRYHETTWSSPSGFRHGAISTTSSSRALA